MALSSGEQALLESALARGQTQVTSSFVPAASRARVNAELAKRQSSVSDADVRTFLETNTGASDAEIARAAKEANVPAEQIARVTGVDVEEVEERIETANTTSNKIAKIYDDVLKRDADTEGLNYWTDQVSSGNLTVSQVENAIKNSQEAQKVKQVEEAYDTFLERAPDEEGLNYWREEVVSGNLTVDDVVKSIATSSEAIEKNPVKAVASDMYFNVLNRAPDAEGLDFWEDEIRKGLDNNQDPDTVISNVSQAMAKAESTKLKNEAADLFKQKVEAKDPTALGTIMYDIKSSGQRVTPEDLESLFGPEAKGGYENSTVAFAIARGLEEVDNALARGDTATAQRLQAEMQNPVAFRDKYKGTEFLSNDIEKEIRQNLLTEDRFYGRSSGGGRGGFFGGIIDSVFDDFLGIDDSGGLLGSTKAFLENPVEAIDRWKDNPAFRAGLYLIPGYGPLIAATTSIVSKYDTGQTPGLLDWASLAMAGADFTAPGGVGADTTSTATKLMEQGVDPSIANKIASQTSATSSALRTAGDVLNTVGGGAQGVINRIVDESGVRDYIGAAGQVVDDPALQGVISGTVGGLVEEVTGGNFLKGFLPELKGTSIDLIPDSVASSLGGLSGMLGDINIPNFDFNLPDVNLGDLQLAGVDLSGLDLSGLNLSGLDLPNVTLGDLNLAGIDLSGLGLPDFNAPDFNLSNVNLPNINLGDLNIPNVGSTSVSLGDLNLPDINIPNLNIPDINLPDTNINQPSLTADIGGVEGVDIRLPNLLRSITFSPGGMRPEDLDLIRGGRGMFGSDEEEVRRISELLLAGVPQPLTIG